MANTFDSKILSRNAIVLREIDAKQKNAKKTLQAANLQGFTCVMLPF